MTPANHLQGNGCKKCGIESMSNALRLTREEFITRAIKVHGSLYDYSNLNYVGTKTKIAIVCRTHGEYKQYPTCHLQGNGCKKCAFETNANAMRLTRDEFITKAIMVHGSLYDYSRVEYIDTKTRIVIVCQIHGNYEQQPAIHLLGHGCKKCSMGLRSNIMRLSTSDFIKRAIVVHGMHTYDYSMVKYTGSIKKIDIICKRHGLFQQSAGGHLQGNGCTMCKYKTEGKLLNILRGIHPTVESQYKRDWCMRTRMLPFDFCLNENKVLIELDGLQHFKQVGKWNSPENQFDTDKFKEMRANSEGFSLIRIIQEDVWLDRYDWLAELTAAIDEIKALPAGETRNIYLCKNGEYDSYQ
jgi:very-short-patch-repair endonuclease